MASGHTFSLPSGRNLGYHVSGPSNGTPIIYIHGHPDSGITITGPLESRVAKDLNIRWIGPDRPGVGLSTPYAAQEILDYPSDIKALAEHLNLTNYYILGTSGGTGFALACAKDLPHEQLKGVGVCAGLGPREGGFDGMSEYQRAALEAWHEYPVGLRDNLEKEYIPLAQEEDTTALTEKMKKDFEAAFKGKDLEKLMEEDTLKMAVTSLRQAWVQGSWAHAKGMEFHWRNWGFDLKDVGFEGVRFWYGKDDTTTPGVMGKYMAGKLEEAKYKEFEGDTHYTVWREGNLQEMVRDLIGGK